MGLLDGILENEIGRLGLGLLAAGSARSDGANSGQRIMEAVGSVDSWRQQKQAAEYKAMLIDAQRRQIAQQEAEANQRQIQAEQLARQRAALGGILKVRGGGGGFSPAADGVFDGQIKFSPLTPPKAELDQNAISDAVRLGVDPKMIQEVISLQNAGKQKVARTIKGIGPDGKEYEYQLDEFGNKQGEGFAQWKAPLLNDGGGQTNVLDPYNPLKPLGSIPKTMTFGDKTSAANLALARERFAFDKAGGVEGIKPKLVGEQWVTAPTDMKAGEVRPAMPSTQQKDAKEALQLIETAREIIPKSTGSYAGAGVDQAARLFGISTGGDTAAAQLKALEGALVSKMPKMSGPQSDKDVLLYKQMAGEIGDPTIPQARKLAALQVIEQIQQRHSGQQASQQTPSNPPMDSLPSAVQYKGRTIRDMRTGKMLTSNGMTWVEAQ